MRRLIGGVAWLLIVAAVGCGSNVDKIIGVWSVTKFDGKSIPADEALVMEFAKEGKSLVKTGKLGKELAGEGSYRVDGEILIIMATSADGKTTTDSFTIKTLGGDTMVLSKDGKDMELKKK